MKKKSRFLIILALALMIPAALMMVILMTVTGCNSTSARPEGPCDIYDAGGNPCVAAHSSTRALYRIL